MSVELSVAIIFKNEIRCLERCLKSLQPLRERLSLEIVMADTGSDDGSRKIAEQYADIVFDFPWIDDFAAARNAVLERCSGSWTFVMDCDEWLGEDIEKLVDFVKKPLPKHYVSGAVSIHNYTSRNLDCYTEFLAARLLRMSAQPYYAGAIHETVYYRTQRETDKTFPLRRVVLHHDGYVVLNDGSKAGEAKRERNMVLLRKKLLAEPDDLRTLMQWIESGDEENNFNEVLRHAVDLVAREHGEWKQFGPAILRDAVAAATKRRLPELEQWAKLAEKMFPDSLLTRIDINFQMTIAAWAKGEQKEVIDRGKAYLQAYKKLQRGNENVQDLWFSTLDRGDSVTEQEVRITLADTYRKQKNYEQAYSELRKVEFHILNADQVEDVLKTIVFLYSDSNLEVDLLMNSFWSGLCEEQPIAKKAKERRQSFLKAGQAFFDTKEEGPNGRVVWQLFLPLAGKCILGDAAELMNAETQEDADAVLERVAEVSSLPASALVHALKIGAAFPIPGKPLTVEDADTLAARLTADRPFLREAAIFASSAAENDQDLIWARALALAAVQSNDWEADADPQPLLAAFVRTGSTFLARCYSAHAMEMPEYLPPMYRFALHLANAYAVLFPGMVSFEFTPTVTGGVRGALAELKEAAIAAPDQKQAIDWILDEILRTNQ